MATTSKTGTGANFTEDGRPIDHSFVGLSEYQNAKGVPKTDYEGLVYDAAGGSRIMTPQGERYFSPYAAQPTKEELSWLMSQPNLTNIQDPTTREQTLESWQKSRPGYVDPMDYSTFEEYIADANPRYRVGKDEGNDLTNRANFYGMTIENYQNALAGDPTRPMGANQAVYGSQLLSPIERLAAETARGQGFSTMSPATAALAQANPDVFNAASQRYQNYFANTYPGTLEYESVLSGPMQFSSAGVKYPEIKDTVSMYILDRRTGQYVKNPNYRGVRKAADGGLMSMANQMASKGRGPDSMLIHMSPSEVQGLQALAMKHGGSLTINPETGLPEAGFLDKLLPTIIGAGLTFFGGVPPHIAAMMVGGVETVRTGDLGKGISAGLGAYGGANLTSGLMEAGTSTIGAAEAAKGLTMTPDLAADLNIAGEGVKDRLLQQQVTDRMAAATPYEKLSSGFDAFGKNPMGMAKSLAAPAAMAFGPAILAGENVQAKGPQTITKPGMIRPYSFDPYGGTYTAGTPYEAQAKKAAGGGLMGLAAGGMAGYGDGDDVSRRTNDGMAQGGMYDFAQRSEPVVRMAGGGIAHFAAGGDAALAAYQAGDYATANRLLGEAGMSAQDVVNKYGLSQADAATVAQNLGYTGNMSGLQYAAAPVVQAPTYTQYTPEQMGSFLSNPVNQNIDINKAIVDTNADPAAVNRYIASLTSPFKGSTESERGSGTFGIYNQFVAQGIDPNEYYTAATANDPKYAGWTKDMIQEAYNLNKGMYALSDAKKGVVTDTDWAKLMVGNGTWDKPQYDVNEMAQATGLSIAEVRARYELEKLKANPTTKIIDNTKVTGTGTGTNTGGTKITTPITYNTIGTNTPAPIESVLGLPPGVSGAGITTVNPNGTITTRPNIPGIPEGGFTGMTSLRDTYEKGGGSLGVNKNLFVPKTQDELFARYKNTGGSKAALDYLMGKTPYSPTPYTPTGEIMKPYFESVGRFPENRKAKKYVFVDGKYQLNPDYVKPSYVLAGEKAAALADPENPPTAKAGEGKKWVWSDEAKKWEVKPINAVVDTTVTGQNDGGGGGEANGGLMAMARGGMTQQFNLGDYSDGGRLLRGPGDGISDSIPATIGNKRPARLADGEFVVPARIVSELGNGSTEAGARKLYAMMDRVQKARRGTVGKGKVAKNSRSDKYLPA